jgi:hypothetical protein
LTLAIILVILSVVTYALDYLVFGDLNHILLYAMGDLAFVFVEVLLVTLVIHEVIRRRELTQKLGKLNMVIGAFYSEVGLTLIRLINKMQCESDMACRQFKVGKDWTHKDFNATIRMLKEQHRVVKVDPIGLKELNEHLVQRRDFLLRLMENPNLLEHERFTELLLAIFHLTDELIRRQDFNALPTKDLAHLGGDAQRAYDQLIVEWVIYLEYLQKSYPYLYSLAIRDNPLDQTANPVVT